MGFSDFKKKKKGVKKMFLLASVMLLLHLPVITYAEQAPEDAIFSVSIGYRFDDGSFDAWDNGSAILVADKYLLTTQNLSDKTSANPLFKKILEERGKMYSSVGVQLSKEEETKDHIFLQIKDKEGKEIEYTSTNASDGLGVIALKETLSSSPIVLESQDEDLAEGQNLKLHYDRSGKEEEAEASIRKKSAQNRFLLNEPLDQAQGAAALNEDSQLVGMVSSEDDTIISAQGISQFLQENSIDFQTKESKEKKESALLAKKELEEKTNQLKEAVEEAEKVDLNRYESTQDFEKALENAKEVLSDEHRTGGQMDVSLTSLQETKAALKEKSLFSKILPYLPFVGIVIAAIAVLTILVKAIKKRKAKKEALARARFADEDSIYDASENLRNADVTVVEPELAERSVASERELPPAGDRYSDFGDVTDLSEETTLLSEEIDDGRHRFLKSEKYKFLLHNDRDNIVGNERGKNATIAIPSKIVSRCHAKIFVKNGTSFLIDLGSRNGTTLNGKKIAPNNEYRIQNQDEICFGNEHFTYIEV